MRRERPPTFMISPASMKKGTASSGKLLAPSMVFCARICASNMFMCHISAAPQASSEKAIGTPMAMAPSSAPRKMVMVMASLRRGFGFAVRHVFGIADADQLGFLQLPAREFPEIVQEEQESEHGEEHAARIEVAHGGFHHRAGGRRVDQHLLPGAAEHQPAHVQHQHV